MSSTPLSDRDINAQIAASNSDATEQMDKKSASLFNNNNDNTKSQRTLQQQIADQNNKSSTNATYISPSDAILSPASQKLAGFKQRQINKQNNKNPTARSLFSRTASTISTGSSLEDAEDVASSNASK